MMKKIIKKKRSKSINMLNSKDKERKDKKYKYKVTINT